MLQGLGYRPSRIEYRDGQRARTEEDQHAYHKLEEDHVYLEQYLAVTTALKKSMSIDAVPRS